ncbi:putative molybdenum carrier protein [Geobacter sulfurreducens]|uniref:putative molybdenum carrier protein n=1 Tax=Geobacter sulfurreducens TaxID=35554 RepID=UPI001E462EF3|nr:putative molybdenum carrier protein [Geobacter sulfurreducens]
MMLKKVISGGQTGVDRAGLDAAMRAGIPVGGYCPKGRKSEDGTIPDIYPLEELATTQYYVRTEKNVIVSDGTLIFNKGTLSQGTKLTYDCATKHLKPCLIVQLDAEQMIEPSQVIRWIQGQQISILNIAGPKESKCPGIYANSYAYLENIFMMLKEA